MSQTYDGILKGDHIEWQGKTPPKNRPMRVQATVMEDETDSSRGIRMAAVLSKIAEFGAFSDIDDPVQWQREVRRERPLPGREDSISP